MDIVHEIESKKPLHPGLKWILMVSMSPIAIFTLIFIALGSLLRFFFKASLLFIVVAIHTPFVFMYNVSLLVFEYYIFRFRKWSANFQKSNLDSQKSSNYHWIWEDPRASVGIEIQIIVSDFFKVVAGELLLVLSAGIITYYTAPLQVFFISMVVSLAAIFHKWLNTNCLSKTALSCLCDGYGLNPVMFLFSFIGFFNIGYHPVAKCSFIASRAFLFANDHDKDGEKGLQGRNRGFLKAPGYSDFNDKDIPPETDSKPSIILFGWNAFERGLFQLYPRIDFITKDNKKYILKSYMVLAPCEEFNIRKDFSLCKYPMERLELPEDYSKINELYNFLKTLSNNKGFVTDKMRGRYEHSLTLLQITEGIQEYAGYNIVDPIDDFFVVAGCTDRQQ